jgi:SAM-dependent methyltransferase
VVFFDALARRNDASPLDPLVAQRYAQARRRWHQKEFRFSLVGDLRGKRILDVGCGAGDNALLLAHRGAEVTGVDVSPASIAVARRRARASGLHARLRFLCAPIEQADLPRRGFDLIWGDGVLHHLLHALDDVLTRLVALAAPGALFVFAEPVALSRKFRALRQLVPVETEHTPDERPLEAAEIAVVRRHLPDLSIRAFGLAGRFGKFVLPGGYEHAPLARRALVDALCLVDWIVLRPPVAQSLASTFVLWGHAAAHGPRAGQLG